MTQSGSQMGPKISNRLRAAKQASFLERHHLVMVAVQDQRWDADFFQKTGNVDIIHGLANADGILG
jgi:hypothetical protein